MGRLFGDTEEIAFTPRGSLQDFTGVPAVVDLAAMRDGIVNWAVTRERSALCSRWSSSSITRCRSITTSSETPPI
jgi:hypothetical protein